MLAEWEEWAAVAVPVVLLLKILARAVKIFQVMAEMVEMAEMEGTVAPALQEYPKRCMWMVRVVQWRMISPLP